MSEDVSSSGVSWDMYTEVRDGKHTDTDRRSEQCKITSAGGGGV